ncbi:MAG: SRPBCC domain-containing protein [Actinomycetota bacterium]|nr:SRPBCC domain-containing protein [Actinomycetota bacterium]
MIDTSTIPGAGHDVRSLVKEAVVGTHPTAAWTAWTTTDEITSWWPAPRTNIDLRVGGPFELLFNLDIEPGLQGSEGCVFLGYVKGEMLSFTWNAPPHLALREKNTWVVLTFSEVADGTHVRLVHTGFLEGADWDAYIEYFEEAWGFVLKLFVDHFA